MLYKIEARCVKTPRKYWRIFTRLVGRGGYGNGGCEVVCEILRCFGIKTVTRRKIWGGEIWFLLHTQTFSRQPPPPEIYKSLSKMPFVSRRSRENNSKRLSATISIATNRTHEWRQFNSISSLFVKGYSKVPQVFHAFQPLCARIKLVELGAHRLLTLSLFKKV